MKQKLIFLLFFSIALSSFCQEDTARTDSLQISLKMLQSRGMPDVLAENLSKRLDKLEKSRKENKLSATELEQEFHAFERSVIHYSSRWIGSYPLSPMFGGNPVARKYAFDEELWRQYEDWRRNSVNLKNFGLKIDAENEIKRGRALKKTLASRKYVDSDPEYDQAIPFWKNTADEKFRLAAKILEDEYRLEGIRKTITLQNRNNRGTTEDTKADIEAIRKNLGGSRWALNAKKFTILYTLMEKREMLFLKLEQTVFASDGKTSVIRPGVSFKSVGGMGFAPSWQSLPIMNVRNCGMFRNAEDDLIPYEGMNLNWEVTFDISDAAFDEFQVKDGSWTYSHRQNTYKGKDGKSYQQECWWSELAPGILLHARAPSITVSDNTAMFPEAPAGYAAVFDGVIRIVRKDTPKPSGKMSEGWVLLFWEHTTLKNPVLLFFENAPDHFSWKKDGLHIQRKGEVGRYAAGLLYGAASRPPEFGRNWTQTIPGEVAAQARALASKLAFFPYDMDEFYALENGKIRIWNVLTKSISLNKNWNTPAPSYIPVPPIYAFAVRCGTPYIRFEQKISEPLLATRYGFFQTVSGTECSYTLPEPDLNLRMALKPIGDNAEEWVERYNKHVMMIAPDLQKKSWGITYGYLNGSFLLKPEVRRHLNFNPMHYEDAMATNQIKEMYTEKAAREHQNFWIEPQTGKSAVVSGWRGKNFGCDLIGDSTLYNQVPLYRNYGRAAFFGEWNLIRRNWTFLKELYSVVPFNHVWRSPGMTCLTTGTVIFGDMLGDGYLMTILMHYMAREMGDNNLAAETLYLAAKQNITTVALLRPQLIEYNAHIKNLPSAQSPDSIQQQLGVDPSGFMTKVWLDKKQKDYTSKWNAPLVSIGCSYHTMLDNIFLAFSPEDTDQWLGGFQKAVPFWTDTVYCLEKHPRERTGTKWGLLQYFAESTRDTDAVQKLYQQHFYPNYYTHKNYPQGIAKNWIFPYYDYISRVTVLPIVITQNDPVWLGNPGNARLYSGTYDRKKRIAEIEFAADFPSALTIVSQVVPQKILLDGKPLPVNSGSLGYDYKIPYAPGIHRIVVSLPEYSTKEFKLPRRGINGDRTPLGLSKMTPPSQFTKTAFPADGAFKVGKCRTIDLRKFCTNDFNDQPLSAKQKDIWLFPKGKETVRGIPFEFIDPEKNGGKSTIFLSGTHKKHLPATISNIPVNCQARRIFFYHGLCYTLPNSKGKMLTYKINFEDGQTRQLECIEGLNIGEWKVFAPDEALPRLPGALPAPVYLAGKKNQFAKGAGGYILEWKNDVRKSGVTNQDTDQQGLAAIKSIDIVSSGKAVPVIIAITVEE